MLGQSRRWGEALLLRFLPHVLPRGFVRTRHFGFLSAAAKARLERARALLKAPLGAPSVPAASGCGACSVCVGAARKGRSTFHGGCGVEYVDDAVSAGQRGLNEAQRRTAELDYGMNTVCLNSPNLLEAAETTDNAAPSSHGMAGS